MQKIHYRCRTPCLCSLVLQVVECSASPSDTTSTSFCLFSCYTLSSSLPSCCWCWHAVAVLCRSVCYWDQIKWSMYVPRVDQRMKINSKRQTPSNQHVFPVLRRRGCQFLLWTKFCKSSHQKLQTSQICLPNDCNSIIKSFRGKESCKSIVNFTNSNLVPGY